MNDATGKEIVNSIPIRFTVAQDGDGFQITDTKSYNSGFFRNSATVHFYLALLVWRRTGPP